jgi:hypothetical protein
VVESIEKTCRNDSSLGSIGGYLEPNYFNRSGRLSASATDHRILPEAELWTQVIVQAITDLDGRTSLTPRSAKDSAREWFASECDGVCSFLWTCQIINVDPNFIRSRIAKKQRMTKSDEVVKISMGQAVKNSSRKSGPLPHNLSQPVATFQAAPISSEPARKTLQS